MRKSMRYKHTQKGKLHFILYFATLFLLAFGVLISHDRFGTGVIFCGALVCLIFGLSSHTLTVKDEGNLLQIVSGPLPLFKKDVQYSEIKDVEKTRSTIIDGWGLHYGIGKGWIINIWGFDCIALKVGEKKFRIGTDDPIGLFEFLKKNVEKESP